MTDRKKSYDPKLEEIRIAVMGNVDAGKSTLLGVLKSGSLDNGRGSARGCIFKHPHEIETGRTSSVSHHYLETSGWKSEELDSKEPDKILTFVDLAGHEKYLKTTLYGVNGSSVSYIMIMISAVDGVVGTTKEHLEIALALRVPTFIVITKMDQAADKPGVLNDNLSYLEELIVRMKKRKLYPIKNIEEVKKMPGTILTEKSKVIPIFKISNTTGEGVDLIRNFFASLPEVIDWKPLRDPSENKTLINIQDSYDVHGIGLVVYGVVKRGCVQIGETILIGPFNGEFKQVVIKSIHDNYKNPLQYLPAGCSGCLAIKTVGKDIIKKNQIKKGMVITVEAAKIQFFKALVQIIHHPTTIRIGYEPTVHCGTIFQTARIMDIVKLDKNTKEPIQTLNPDDPNYDDSNLNLKLLRAGDLADVTFKFLHHLEFIESGSTIFFREGDTKGLGKITIVMPEKLENFIKNNRHNNQGRNRQRKKRINRSERSVLIEVM
jgi:GTPase